MYRNETLQLQVKGFLRVREGVQCALFSIKPVTVSLSFPDPFPSSLFLPVFLSLLSPPPSIIFSSPLSSLLLSLPILSTFCLFFFLLASILFCSLFFFYLRQVLCMESRMALNLCFCFLNTIIIAMCLHSWLKMK